MPEQKIILSQCQQRALLRMLDFAKSQSRRIFILKGYAGTGKTTLVKSLIKELGKAGINYQLLASTGRAAKILSNTTGVGACTVHSLIYRYNGFNQDIDKIVKERESTMEDKSGQLYITFGLGTNNDNVHLYIIDEASMVSNERDPAYIQAKFGTGRLLSDLLEYDCQGKFIFVGDGCQLPPIRQQFSPALNVRFFKEQFGLDAEEVELTEIVRQSHGNDIVASAKRLRDLCSDPQPWVWARFPLKGYSNIHVLRSPTELQLLYLRDMKSHGFNAATMIGYTNRQCMDTTEIVRQALGKAGHLSPGDLLLVTQNNSSGLMNGDLVEVTSVGDHIVRRAGLTFVYVSVKELFTGMVTSIHLILDVLESGRTNLSPAQQKELYIDFHKRMSKEGIKQKSPEYEEQMRKDQFLNALRCVYGYELTVHKAQGGEWDNVYLDIPRSFARHEKPFVYQWVYTAMTRARKELYVVDDFYMM